MRARKQGRVGGRPKLVLDRDQVRRLREEGKSLREISDAMGLSLTTTARITTNLPLTPQTAQDLRIRSPQDQSARGR
jgi:DNA invertase Pin-like site-specific DNA recombinase